jgi:excisionase family DNA binding protein
MIIGNLAIGKRYLDSTDRAETDEALPVFPAWSALHLSCLPPILLYLYLNIPISSIEYPHTSLYGPFMEEPVYSTEQVAERLGLHVKTVRSYVREGRLKAVRIGKQYRIAAADLATMMGRPVSSFDQSVVRKVRRAEVYTIVEVDAVSPELSGRVTNMLLGAAGSNDHSEDVPTQIKAIYDAARGQLKLILIGNIETTAALLKMVNTLVEVEK